MEGVMHKDDAADMQSRMENISRMLEVGEENRLNLAEAIGKAEQTQGGVVMLVEQWAAIPLQQAYEMLQAKEQQMQLLQAELENLTEAGQIPSGVNDVEDAQPGTIIHDAATRQLVNTQGAQKNR